MKIISWNINGIRAIIKKDFIIDNKSNKNNTFINFIKKEDPDIICFTEIKICLNGNNIEKLIPLPEYYKYFNSCTVNIKKGSYSGVLILTKILPNNINTKLNENSIFEREGRFIHLEFDKFNLVNVYVPNSGDKLKRLKERTEIWDLDLLNKIIKLKKEKSTIICGDFNSIHLEIDSYNFKSHYNKLSGVTESEITNFKKILNNGYNNVYRMLYPNKIQYSYFTYRFNARSNNKGLLIDFFLVSDDLVNKIKDIKYLNNIYGSDHLPVLLLIDL